MAKKALKRSAPKKTTKANMNNAPPKTSSKKESPQKKQCAQCLTEKRLTEYYNSASEVFSDGKMPICKTCIKTMVDPTDMHSVMKMLRIIDKPFIQDVWDVSAKSNPLNIFGDYIRKVNSLPNYKDLTWDDGITGKEAMTAEESAKQVFVPSEFKEKWGSGYTYEEYMKLEYFYDDMTKSYSIETASHRDYLKKICKVSMKMEEAIDNNMVDEFKKLSDVYDKLMHSSKFTAVQRTAADKTGGMTTFGEFFEMIEKRVEEGTGFIPHYYNDEDPDIVDKTLENLKNFTRRLIYGDPNIAQQVDEYHKRVSEGYDDEDMFDEEGFDSDNEGDES